MVSLTHIGVFTDRPVEMRDFYRDVLGMIVSDQGVGNHFKRNISFLTSSEDHHHQFVLVEREEGDPPGGALFQVSFEQDSLDDIRRIKERAERAGATGMRGLNHGNSWSIYFADPDGNLIEIYTDTGWYVPQPFGDPLDLSLSNEELRRLTDARVSACEGAAPLEEWVSKTKARLEDVRP